MIEDFGHHFIPLFREVGTADSKTERSFTDIKEVCKSVDRIQGALKMASRNEIAVSPTKSDFFDQTLSKERERATIWSTIKKSKNLQWVILTRHLLEVKNSLPTDWHGKGYKNVCIGFAAENTAGLREHITDLQSIPAAYRLLHLQAAENWVPREGNLDGIDWVIFSGSPENKLVAASIHADCLKSGTAFYWPYNDDKEPPILNGSLAPLHPFGDKIKLGRPTIPGITAMVAKTPTSSAIRENHDPCTSPAEPLPRTEPQPQAHVLDTEIVQDLVVQIDADQTDFRRLDKVVRRSLRYFIQAGEALAEIRDRELWRVAGLDSWAAYCTTVGGLSKVHANRLIRAAEIAHSISHAEPIGFTPHSESQIRPLGRLENPNQYVEAWTIGIERAGAQPTAKLLREIVAEQLGDNPPEIEKVSRAGCLAKALSAMRDAIETGAKTDQLIRLLEEIERVIES